MNVNLASANLVQQYANTLQGTAQQVKVPEQQVDATSIPDEPSKDARPVQQTSETSMGRSIDVYV